MSNYIGTYNRLGVPIHASGIAVIKAASRKLLKPASRYSREQRRTRHAAFRELLEIHKRSRDLASHFRL